MDPRAWERGPPYLGVNSFWLYCPFLIWATPLWKQKCYLAKACKRRITSPLNRLWTQWQLRKGLPAAVKAIFNLPWRTVKFSATLWCSSTAVSVKGVSVASFLGMKYLIKCFLSYCTTVGDWVLAQKTILGSSQGSSVISRWLLQTTQFLLRTKVKAHNEWPFEDVVGIRRFHPLYFHLFL